MKNLFATIFLILAMLPVNTWALADAALIEDSPSYKLHNNIPINIEDFANRTFVAVTRRNGRPSWRFIIKFDNELNPDVYMCCTNVIDMVDQKSIKLDKIEMQIKGQYFNRNGAWPFTIYLNEMLATFSMKVYQGILLDSSMMCEYGDIDLKRVFGKHKELLNYDCNLMKSGFDKQFFSDGGVPESFSLPGTQFARENGLTRWSENYQKPVLISYKKFLDEKRLLEVAAEQIARQEEDRQERAAAERLAEAERQRKLEAAALANAEKARLEAEIRDLREAQRDRLREAFGKRSQAEREAIQQRLFERGLYKSTVDGSFGTGTRSAIEEYARANNQIDLKSSEGAATVITELVSLQPSTTGAVIVAAKGRAPLDLSKQANAKIYLDDIREFVSLNPKELDPLVLGGSYSPAIQEVQSRTFNKAGSNFLRLVAYTRSSAPFREFLEAKLEKRFEAEEGERTAIAKVIVEQVNAMKTRLAANPLASDAFQLSQLIKNYGKVPQEASAETLKELRYLLEGELKKLGVSVADAPASTVGEARPFRASTVDLKALSDVEAKDIVILVNLSKSAPHAFRNLSGEIAFEDKEVNLCAPSLGVMKPQYRAFFEAKINKALTGHKYDTDERCRDGLKGYDALVVTGTDLARSQDIPPADVLVAALNKKTLARMVTVKHSDFTRELAKREILSDQYESDIREGARVGFGALAFRSDAKVACTVVEENLDGHDLSIISVLSALQFLNGTAIKETTNVSVDVAFRQAQKGQCALIYASGKTLKIILGAAANAGLAPTVLPVWTTSSAVAKRAKELLSKQENMAQSEAERLAELRQNQTEEESRQRAKASQLEERQKRYRAQNNAKVASLVSAIDASLKEVRGEVDSALGKGKNLKPALSDADFWGDYPAWYADKRMKGWEFDSTVPTPKDYGVAKWNGRDVEAVTAQIRVLMKNRELGKYSDDCWNVGYLLDKEFSMRREPFTQPCDDNDALNDWQVGSSFETRWDLGVK